jgi:hypothetical protein
MSKTTPEQNKAFVLEAGKPRHYDADHERRIIAALDAPPPKGEDRRHLVHASGRLSQVCERWIYGCVCFALDFDEQKRSGFRYQYSSYQIEYSCNLVFQVGGHLDQVFQALIDRSRAPLDFQTIKTILGSRRRPRYHARAKRSAECEPPQQRSRNQGCGRAVKFEAAHG